MQKTTKICLVAAACLVFVGLTLFAVVMSVYHWDFKKLSTEAYETNTFEIDDLFDGISINSETSDIRFALSDDGKCRVVCYEQKHVKHEVSIQDNTLIITEKDSRKWYEYIGLNFGSCEITVYLPKKQFSSLSILENTGDIEIPGDFSFGKVQISISTGDINFFASTATAAKIKTSTGDILLNNLTADTLDLSSTTGNITISGVTVTNDIRVKVSTGDVLIKSSTCMNLTSDGTTGDLTLKNVIVAEKLTVKQSTGDVILSASDAAEIYIKTSTGDVTGSLLSEKVFFTETDTGDVNVPKSMSGGRCEITTSTGDIHFTQ